MLRRVALGLACTGTAIVGIALQAQPSFAASPGSSAVTSGGDYLALGDSVSFGYREAKTTPPPNYLKPNTFIGYPEYVGAALDFHVANASCPGETSASLIVQNVQSNGCENSPGGGPGYRSRFPLHVSYSGTQLQYAVRYLKAHPDTKLVSLMIGANDAFLCQETTKDGCASELPGVLKQISANVSTILSVVRDEAHYTGQVIIVNYYSLDYANPVDNASSQSLNQAMDRGAAPFDVRIANGYRAFEKAAVHSGGNSCTAGLLTQLTTGTCGVHPTVAGQSVLAQTVVTG